jgi:hypothetical protein
LPISALVSGLGVLVTLEASATVLADFVSKWNLSIIFALQAKF